MTSQISFIGLGNMGTALAQAHLKAGTKITIWNRTASRPSVETLVKEGASFEPSLRAALEASPVVVICVLQYSQIYSLLEPLAAESQGLRKLGTILNVTNGTAQDAVKFDKWIREQGVQKYLDGAIMTAPYMIGQEHAFVFCSGEDEAFFQETEHVIKPWGRADYLGEDPGAASLYDAALLAAMYGMFGGGMTGLALLQRAKPGKNGMPKLEPLAEKYMVPLVQTFVPHIALMAKEVDTNTHPSGGHPMEMQATGLETIVRGLKEERVEPVALEGMLKLARGLCEEGGADTGLSALSLKYLKN